MNTLFWVIISAIVMFWVISIVVRTLFKDDRDD